MQHNCSTLTQFHKRYSKVTEVMDEQVFHRPHFQQLRTRPTEDANNIFYATGVPRSRNRGKHKSPWLLQGLKERQGAVGIAPSAEAAAVAYDRRRSPAGGWLDEEEWMTSMRQHIPPRASIDFRKVDIGRFIEPSKAIPLLQAMRAQYLQRQDPPGLRMAFRVWLRRTTLQQHRPQLDEGPSALFYASLDHVAYAPAVGNWLPVGGCMHLGQGWSEELLRPHRINISPTVQALPMVGSGHLNSPHVDALNKIFRSYAETNVIRRWQWEWGFPTVVNSAFMMQKILESGAVKQRALWDHRFANGVVDREGMSLPSIWDVVAKIQPGQFLLKQDCASGFHQQRIDHTSYHMACVIFEGELWYFCCSSYGWRCVPKGYCKRTTAAASKIPRLVATVAHSFVYVDDIISIAEIPKASASRPIMQQLYDTEAEIISVLTTQGLVLGKKKCEGPATQLDVLGLWIDTVAQTISVSTKKSAAINCLLQKMVEEQETSSLEVARLVGKLNAIEPAIPLIRVFLRPLYRDLANTVAFHRGEQHKMPELQRGRDAEEHFRWHDWPMQVSQQTRETLQYVRDNWTQINGRSYVRRYPHVLVRSDASGDGGGISLWLIQDDGTFRCIARMTIIMQPELREESSTAREAWALAKGVKNIPESVWQGQKEVVVEGIVDNKGVSTRSSMGSKCPKVNAFLMDLARSIQAKKAVWNGSWWSRRSNMTAEDHDSRAESLLHINKKWLKRFLHRKPNPQFDAFADRSNAVCANYATLGVDEEHEEGSKVVFDGLRANWGEGTTVWCFPPAGLIGKAYKKFCNSSCALAYFCTPLGEVEHGNEVRTSPFRSGKVEEAKVMNIPSGVKWRFGVTTLSRN